MTIEAYRLYQSTWRSYDVVSIDFETTGTDPLTCEPVEVSAVRFNGAGNIIKRFTSLLKPSAPIPAEATAVHGITDDMVKDAPTLLEVAPQLIEIADGALPLAFNRQFDKTILTRYLTGTDVPLFDPATSWLCTYAMAWGADRYEPGKGRLKLSACCERRGIRVVGAHRAEADAIASGMLFYALMAGTPEETSMQSILERVAMREDERERDYQQYKRKMREAERVVWRQYAAAALGAVSVYSPDVATGISASMADAMIKLENERYS